MYLLQFYDGGFWFTYNEYSKWCICRAKQKQLERKYPAISWRITNTGLMPA